MLKACIFDLNGTILDDEGYYNLAFRRVLEGLGVKLESDFQHRTGIGVKENWRLFESKYHFKTDRSLDELVSLTQNEYLKFLDKVKLREGFLELARNLKLSGIKIALATSNSYYISEKILARFNLEDFFDTVTTTEEVFLNKPSPQIFLLTAEKLGVEPYECLVFEDSGVGVEAALSAGMAVIGIAENKEEAQHLAAAQKIIRNFRDFKFLSSGSGEKN